MNYERNKAQVAFLSATERAPSQEGAPLVTLGGSLKNCLQGARSFTGERAPPQESVPLLKRVRPFRLQRALSEFAHRGRALSQESAPLLRRARPFSGGHTLLAQGAHQELTKIRHNFA